MNFQYKLVETDIYTQNHNIHFKFEHAMLVQNYNCTFGKRKPHTKKINLKVMNKKKIVTKTQNPDKVNFSCNLKTNTDSSKFTLK